VRGPDGAPLVTVYADFECPYCAALELRLKETAVRVCFRHFPVRTKHPRAWAAAQAAEAAAAQDAFWAMHDALYGDQGRLEDPHLWARAERLGLDVARFHRDARSDETRRRVEEDFRSGIRAGVATTPTLFLPDGSRISGRPGPEVWARLV
jgi:protein-disulfide isomerase